MRIVSFQWGGQTRSFTPTMTVLAAMASDLARVSEGAENTLSLAQKMNAGGADPVFAATALWHLLRASGAEVTRDQCYEQMMGDGVTLVEKAGFRMAYLQSVLPSVDMGKKPEAPAVRPSQPKARRKK